MFFLKMVGGTVPVVTGYIKFIIIIMECVLTLSEVQMIELLKGLITKIVLYLHSHTPNWARCDEGRDKMCDALLEFIRCECRQETANAWHYNGYRRAPGHKESTVSAGLSHNTHHQVVSLMEGMMCQLN